ncbi:pentapeptide repeat-containing protein [Actinomadura graeca]|uniref:Pentapeptide repeat-containing protein n=1 Tax=Actinomadura graeca TaxID=2750812 RepID=A0ABX8QYF0_9ACTN|nr:pentapeptide repeat-containing protein [Actinomadura graeca]QXJ23864.1 pentapeptide repeat-containing protein [Actinomadura graeca]
MSEPTDPVAEPGASETSRPTQPPGGAPADHRRRWRARVVPPTQDQLDALSARERLELLDRRRADRHQWFNTGGILLTLVLTALGLYFTRQSLAGGQEGQLTDRYTKAVEQLGSPRQEVRLAAVYALERLAGDSGRDHNTIMDVLAAYVRVHSPAPRVATPREPAADVQAALTVLARNDRTRQPHALDLHGVRIPGADLASSASSSARRDTYFHGPYLTVAELRRSGWYVADLRGAILEGADLGHAALGAADLGSSNLRQAVLRNAGLYGARLHGADLTGADLTGADLRNADLTRVQGITPQQIRRIAQTDSTTRF